MKIFWGDAREKICEAIDKIPLSCLVIGNRGLGKLKRLDFINLELLIFFCFIFGMFFIVIVLLPIMLDIMLKLRCLFPPESSGIFIIIIFFIEVIWDFRCSLLENFLYVAL